MTEEKIYDQEFTIKGVTLGRDGVNKKNVPWQLYNYELELDGQKRFATAFKKYDVGESGMFKLKESPNPKNAQYPYLNILSKVDEAMPEQQQETPAGAVDLLSDANPFTPNPQEFELMNQIKALPDQSKVTEAMFIVTAKNRLKMDDARAKLMWEEYRK